MSDEKTPGVLLKSDDGNHYFIPAADLSQYAVGDLEAGVSDGVARAAPQVHAFAVKRSGGESGAAPATFDPMPEG
jgi:hypothetical protein